MSPSRQRSTDPHASHLSTLLLVASLVASAATAAPTAEASEPWLAEPFAADPKAIAEAVKGIDDDDDVVVLLDSVSISIDDQRRVSRTTRLVYLVVSPRAVESWAVTSSGWKPSHQERPEIRARVITPDGEQFELDPKTLDDSPAHEEQASLFDDRRVLRAPLPHVKPGVVIEEQIVVRDTEPLFPAGWSTSFNVGRYQPIRRYRLDIDAPEDSPLRHKLLAPFDIELETETTDGRRRLSFRVGPLEPIESRDRYRPSDVPPSPRILISTGETWNHMARAYSALVEERLQGSELGELAREAAGDTRDRREIVDRMLAKVQDRIRYTGIEFGESSIVPASPSRVLERSFGDCKDQSTLIVGMLRELEIPAHVALLQAGSGFDVDPEQPGLGRFNHAIVYVPGEPDLWPDLWIDPTDPHSLAGELPSQDEGRLALIADDDTKELLRTPAPKATDNHLIETREVYLQMDGPARVVELSETRGEIARSYRSAYTDVDPKDTREMLEEYVKNTYVASKLKSFEHDDPEDRETVFNLRLEAEDAETAITSEGGAAVSVSIESVFDWLPYLPDPNDEEEAEADDAESESDSEESGTDAESADATESASADRGEPQSKPAGDGQPEDEPKRLREFDLVLTDPHVLELKYRIVPPPGLRAMPLPEDRNESFGPARYDESYKVADDGSVEAHVRFDTGARRFTPAQAEDLRAGVVNLRKDSNREIHFENIGHTHLLAGRIREAITEFRRLAALRLACPCAGCVEEWTRKKLPSLDEVPDDVRPVRFQTVGRYAIQPTWSDGHKTGIYSFQDLRGGAGQVDPR